MSNQREPREQTDMDKLRDCPDCHGPAVIDYVMHRDNTREIALYGCEWCNRWADSMERWNEQNTRGEPAMIEIKRDFHEQIDYVVLYHGGGCLDGFTAAWVLAKFMAENAPGAPMAFIPMQYNKTIAHCAAKSGHVNLPSDGRLCRGKIVYMLDFSMNKDEMLQICRESKMFYVLDHHKTAQEAISAAFEYGALGKFDNEQSGAAITWEWLYGPHRPIPKIVQYVQDRDLWRFNLPNTEAITAVLASHPHDLHVWTDLAKHIATPYNEAELIREGYALLRQRAANIDRIIGDANGHQAKFYVGEDATPMWVPAVNAPPLYASDICHELLDRLPDAPFVAAWSVNNNNAAEIIVNLRSENHRQDVGAIAKQYGGGGHRNAAGFTIPVKSVAWATYHSFSVGPAFAL